MRTDSTRRVEPLRGRPARRALHGRRGIRPAAPGFAKLELRPQLGDLEELELVCHTPRGPVTFRAKAQEEGHRAWVTLPPECPGELVLPVTEGRGVALTASDRALGLERFALPAGETTEFDVPAIVGYLRRPSFFSRKISSAAPATDTAHCATTP